MCRGCCHPFLFSICSTSVVSMFMYLCGEHVHASVYVSYVDECVIDNNSPHVCTTDMNRDNNSHACMYARQHTHAQYQLQQPRLITHTCETNSHTCIHAFQHALACLHVLMSMRARQPRERAASVPCVFWMCCPNVVCWFLAYIEGHAS